MPIRPCAPYNLSKLPKLRTIAPILHEVNMTHSADNSSQNSPPGGEKSDPDTQTLPTHPLQPSTDPLPNPEPAAPSLDQPDPGVFHHVPVKSHHP